MSAKIDITGKRYGGLVVLGDTGKRKNSRVVWKARCDCGNVIETNSNNLRTGNTTSCGCYRSEYLSEAKSTHGKSKTREYKTYLSMKKRCYDKDSDDYYLYGGRGIVVSSDWLEGFENFYRDMGDRPEGYSLDRIDPNGNYTKENCRWASSFQQAANRRKNSNCDYKGVSKHPCGLFGMEIVREGVVLKCLYGKDPMKLAAEYDKSSYEHSKSWIGTNYYLGYLDRPFYEILGESMPEGCVPHRGCSV